ncbi:MAG TPA: methionine--tRNA ligase [Solirubrobacteraceae bacterium]|nr:methionine--tRNA ligase [Solirubrobacteraceae bacterium]
MGFYVTTAISYVNAVPHLGHAYEAIAADVLARNQRARGADVFFLTGTDEHGEPVADAAAAVGVAPKELADRNAARFRALAEPLELSNDFFIRTTDAGHYTRVQEILQRVYDAGHVYLGSYEGWYCPRCADFKTDAEIGPGNTCLIHGIALGRESEENYFFRLSSFQQPLEALFEKHRDFVLPRHAYNEARNFLAGGLTDVSLTRKTLSWGVDVPWDPGHVFYVWFDALLNYVTALGYAREGEDLTDRFWPATFHVIGKDILKFHAIYWPALLLAAGLAVPRHVFVHGFLLGPDGEKMSKSLGNVLDPFAVIDEFGADVLRHYLLREVTAGQDGPVSLDGLRTRYETELANEYGNLASRTLNMLGRYCDGRVAAVALDESLRDDLGGLSARVDALLDRAELSAALDDIWQQVRRLNRYVEEHAPWQLSREPGREAELATVLASLAEGLRVVTVALNPYMPAKTAALLEALGRPELDQREYAAEGWGGPVGELAALFPK